MVSSPSFAEMRQRNSFDVVSLVRKNSGISRAELATEARLAKATISEIVDDLLQKRILLELGVKASGGGRPAIGLAFNPSFGYVFGICLDETEILGCLLDLDGNVQKEVRMSLREGWSAVQVGSFLIESLDSALAELDRSRTSILSVGVAIPGPVETSLTGELENVSGEYGKVTQFLKSQIKCSLIVDSNTNMAAIAEVSENSVRESELVMVARLGHKIRSALVASGSILRGSGGLAGELGHISIPCNQSLCSCGAVGCINTVSSIGAMLGRCRAAGIKASNFDEVVSCCLAGDRSARQIVREAGEALAYGIAMSINLLAPHVVIISGLPSAAEELILSPLRETVSSLALSDNCSRCKIIAGSSTKKVESYGAGLLALKKLSILAAS